MALLRASERQQSGTNIYASQRGSGGMGKVRDVLNKTTGTGGITEEMSEEKVKASDGIIPLQMGECRFLNKLIHGTLIHVTVSVVGSTICSMYIVCFVGQSNGVKLSISL